MRSYLKSALLTISSLSLCACMVGPNFHSPTAPNTSTYTAKSLPKKTVSISNAGNAGKSQQLVNQDIPADWWNIYHSKEISQLINIGLGNSPTLAAAESTLKEAQENLQAQIGSLLLPSINGQFGFQRTRQSGLLSGVDSPPTIFTLYNPGFQISYLLDIFGGSRRQIEEYRAQMDYERYELIAAYLTLTSNIVTTSINIASLQAQIKATQELIQTETNLLAIVQKQVNLGGASEANVITQQTQLAQTQALLPPLQEALAQSQDALSVLIGKLPSQSNLPNVNLDKLNLPAKLPLSLPSELVRQRPDIQASEALLHEASAGVGVATANLFPKLALSGNYGWLNTAPARLLTSNSNIWSLASQLSQPLFQGGALQAERRAAIDAYNTAYQQYRQTVLQAFQNVSDVLNAIQMDALEFKAQKQAEISARENLMITQKQFKLGGASYLEVLTAEQQYLQARINSIKAQATRYTDTAALYQALGGGWWNQTLFNPSTQQQTQKSTKH